MRIRIQGAKPIRLHLDPNPGQKKLDFYMKISFNVDSVADPGCLSRIPDTDFYPSRIPDPKTGTKERGEKN
jgi:hypothetical protein